MPPQGRLGDYGSGASHPTAAQVIYDPGGRTRLLTFQGWVADEAPTAEQARYGAREAGVVYPIYSKARYRALVQIGASQNLEFALRRPAGRGDGTVPESSGRGLDIPLATAMPARPTREAFTPIQLGIDGLEHEPAYQDNTFSTSDSHTFVLRSIEALCQDLILREAGPA